MSKPRGDPGMGFFCQGVSAGRRILFPSFVCFLVRSESRFFVPTRALLTPAARGGAQKKTGRPIKFELTEQTRQAIEDYLRASGKKPGEFLFTSSRHSGRCMTTRLCSRCAPQAADQVGRCRDVMFVEQLRRAGFSSAALVIFAELCSIKAPPPIFNQTGAHREGPVLGF